ncbi:MAG: carbon starvation protein A [Syntrophales bacterium]|nr:carbon starvation protein A [Syntrophales bacterium]MDD4339323.1 carbon starvation protein A [Syntrophales bacterium]HOG07408.1 carbon starvation protein A [Syntrophales bacterium]HOS76819.1 carbon starvation protein A [Syntrophales bacterium]HPB69488.1 carbon starvation protein A [Syntrophales bacterium]
MTTLIILVGLAIYVLLYFLYGKKLERDVVGATDANEAPSSRLYDGVDYIPARKAVLFGHHFSSIAGAAPIIGPALAMAYGWVPGLLWVWFGNVFIGAVHDYLALMASVRYDGRSIQFVASDLMGKRTGTAFYWLVFFLLILVVAAFSAVVGGMFVKTPAIASAYVWSIVAALILGVLIYRVKMNFTLASVIGVIMLAVAIFLGVEFPMPATYETWMYILFFYIIIAAAIPVNVLLQPRDYQNSFLLYAGLILGLLAAVFAFRGFEVPAFTSFSPILTGGKPTPFWPAIPLIIACGSLSGFHSLVASGTTSKQLTKESDGLLIGYGAMFTEGFLSTIVVVAIAGFGFTALQTAAAEKGIEFTLTASTWATQFTPLSSKLGLSQANLFIQSYADMVAATWLSVIPTQYVKVLAGMWVAAFALTTLDTTNRLARYCVSEMALPLKGTSAGLYNFLTNRWIASLIPAFIGIYLAYSKNFTILWPSFGAANQLIASIALMTGACWVHSKLQSRFCHVAVIPAWILWVTVTAALVWFMWVPLPANIASSPVQGWTVMGISIVMLIMNFIFIVDFVKKYYREQVQSK